MTIGDLGSARPRTGDSDRRCAATAATAIWAPMSAPPPAAGADNACGSPAPGAIAAKFDRIRLGEIGEGDVRDRLRRQASEALTPGCSAPLRYRSPAGSTRTSRTRWQLISAQDSKRQLTSCRAT